jgi:hypothetical protein
MLDSLLIAPQDFLHPELSVKAQALFRISYGVLLLGTLILALPHWRRFFMSERWGGYAQSSRDVDFLQNPIVSPLIAVLWLACAVLITLGWWAVWAALLNLLLCRYFFVRMRWKGVLRGFGAPGFMSYWAGAAVFLLEYTLHYAPALRPLALLVSQVDFAFIMLSAGIYKWTAGYARNNGMEGGMVNPQWGYWGGLWTRFSPHHWIFKQLNHLAWSLEVLAGVLMLVPPTRFLGGLLILSSFIFIATQIRLGLLCEVVIACCFIFFHPGSIADQWITTLIPAAAESFAPTLFVPAAVNTALGIALWAYLILLPLAHAGLFYNFYGRKRLPAPLQSALETYTNFFGIIIWRVFSVDHTNFFVRIYRRRRDDGARGERSLVSAYGLGGPPSSLAQRVRYNHVGESITITSLFTTLKYYPGNDRIFRERVLRYARTVPCPADCVLEFEYVSIRKATDKFEFVPVTEYTVDAAAETIEERVLDESFSVRAAHKDSPVHEGVRPGSYVSLKG